MGVRRKPVLSGVTVSLGLAVCGCSAASAPTVGPPTSAAPVGTVRRQPQQLRRPRPRAAPPATTPPTAPPSPPPTTRTDGDDGGTRQQHVHDPGLGRPAAPHLGDRHGPVVRRRRGYDFTPMFWAVRPIVDAVDLAVCHLETPVAPPGTAPDGSYPTYGVPAQIAPALAASGFDRCSVASNHSLDKGEAGIDSTLNALDAAGLGHAGMARDAGGGRSERCSTSAARPWPTCRTRSGSTAGACPRPAMAVEPDRSRPHRRRRPAGPRQPAPGS